MSNEVVGYARVSTSDQDVALQLDALRGAGVERIFKDVGSGSLKHRPQLDECLDRSERVTRWSYGSSTGSLAASAT
jgi:DNA invertase Pin-like site-specific DNA recombinase